MGQWGWHNSRCDKGRREYRVEASPSNNDRIWCMYYVEHTYYLRKGRYTDRHYEIVTGLHMRIILASAPCLAGTACAAAAAEADAPRACPLACLLASGCLLRGVAGSWEVVTWKCGRFRRA
ncbi:hypothetical protein F4804DRAFT_242766 [Jackrogersella minutella]|nr:hypothetical protein F4804DRAFT_242766 [Jackrogersella minutella]